MFRYPVNLRPAAALHSQTTMTTGDPNLPDAQNAPEGSARQPVLPGRLQRDLAQAMQSSAGTTLSPAVRARLSARAAEVARLADDRRQRRWRIGGAGGLRWAGGLAAAAMVGVAVWVGLANWGARPGPLGPGLPLGPIAINQPGPVPDVAGRSADPRTDRDGGVSSFGMARTSIGPDVVDVLASARAASNGAEGADAAASMLRRIVSLDNFVAVVPVPGVGPIGGVAMACGVESAARQKSARSWMAWVGDGLGRELGQGARA